MFSTSGQKTLIEGTSDSFNLRQKSVFDQLDKLEKDRPGCRYSEEEFSESQHKRKKVKLDKRKPTSELVGQESIFKTPEPPKQAWLGKIPDHKLNPHRWTKYSLSDVSDMSERSNTAAAMSFLREQGSPLPAKDRIPVAPKFTRVSSIELAPPRSRPPAQHPLFKSSTREMPEYVVGQKKPRSKGSKAPAEQVTSQIKLDHLLDQDD